MRSIGVTLFIPFHRRSKSRDVDEKGEEEREAILLLDQADIYLKRRSNQDLVRNSLFSVFLYKLEYYKVLFLITNRVSQFNKTILSYIYLI